MASSPPPEPNKSLIPDYFSQLKNTLLRLLPSSSGVSNLLTKIASVLHPSRLPRKPRRRRRTGLPLPLRSLALASSSATNETSLIVGILDDIMDHCLTSMHEIQKNLQFWQSRAEGTDAQKVYFMVFERGPRVFISETIHIVSRYTTEGSSIQNICYSAATSISEKISILLSLQYCLATFLAQLYIEADKHEEQLIRDPGKAFPSLLLAINTLFLKLGTSVAHRRELYVDNSCVLAFEKLPDIDNERPDWSLIFSKNATDMIYQNLERLDSYTSILVSHCQKPRRLTLYWLRYTCGAVGLSLGTIWLLRHSRFMGSSDIDDWFQEAKESVAGFWKSHVEQPLISIRDELFETFRRRHKTGVIEVEEVKMTEDSLHRMLLTFSEQTRGQKFPIDASDQEMLEIVMARYEKELMHPIQNLFSGEIARAMLIQIQKLKLDLETAMLELDQILKANEINFAILAALPAFFLSVITLMLVRAWFLQDKGAEGRGRLARLQRRLLVAEIEKNIMRYQTCIDQGMEEDALKMLGLVLYSLDRLYKASERNATESGEWLSLKQDILDIGNPGMRVEHKLVLTSRMERVYECMLPSLKRH